MIMHGMIWSVTYAMELLLWTGALHDLDGIRTVKADCNLKKFTV
jgi:hypothetical protein